MKKFLSVLLATAILLSVCAVSVFADPIETYHQLSTNQSGQLSLHYISEEELIVEGWADLYINSGRSILYGVTIQNKDEEHRHIIYDGYIQCAATFSDDSMDVDSYFDGVALVYSAYDNIYRRLYLPLEKTLVSLDTEFQVLSSSYLMWEGSISKQYTPGVNI